MKPIDTDSSPILSRLQDWIQDYQPRMHVAERGSVVSVGDGIAWVRGLPSAAMDDLLEFEDGSTGMVFDLSEDLVGAVLLHETPDLTSGTPAHLSRHRLEVPAGDDLIGRVIDPLGIPMDGESEPDTQCTQPI